jgi:hypothetical protein
VRVPYTQWLSTLNSPTLVLRFEHQGPLFLPHDVNISRSNAYEFTYRASQIRGDLDLVEAGMATMAPVDFNGNASARGWALLTLGCAILLAGVVEARRADRRTKTAGSLPGRPTATRPQRTTGMAERTAENRVSSTSSSMSQALSREP